MTHVRDSIISRQTLVSFGMTPRRIRRAVAEGRLLRIRQGWYATANAPADMVRAVRVGGALTSLSAARHYELWTPTDRILHVAVPRNASRLRSPDATGRPLAAGGPVASSVCVHWARSGQPDDKPVASVYTTLIDAVDCQPEERAIVVIDSALNKGLVSPSHLKADFASLPRRYRRALEKADGRSQSGTETLVRLRLRALGVRLAVQVRIAGVGHVDLLIGDRLVIECDSREWHAGRDSYYEDRRRDLELVALGYVVMRLTYEMVLFQWPAVEAVIRRKLAAREHLWPRKRE